MAAKIKLQSAETARLSHLDAVAKVLELYSRPMTSPEIVAAILEHNLTEIGGETPWKTIGARLASDIRSLGHSSRFKRTYHGRYALMFWDYEPEFQVQKRVLSPLDETIKAVPIDRFKQIARSMASGEISSTDFRALIVDSVDIPRREAEDRFDFVQLIPTFIVRRGDEVLTYRRTKRLPEARLHHARCVNFGGHMQADDAPMLFWNDDEVVNHFLYRELFEELEFEVEEAVILPMGLLYLQNNDFERQHAGLTFSVSLERNATARSLEPGMHTDLSFTSISTLNDEVGELDSWSQVLIKELDYNV